MYASDFWVLSKHLVELNDTSIYELIHGKNKTEVKEGEEPKEEEEELPHLQLIFKPFETYYFMM